MEQGVAAGRSRTDRLGRQLGGGQIDTALFDSGYLPLAALDRAPHEQRVGSSFTVNLDRGGDATRIAVIQGRGAPNEPGAPLRATLERYADQIARDTGTVAAAGGPAPTLQDFATEAKRRLPLLALALVLVTYLALVPTLRSLVLPLLAVLLNVLTVAAAFGVLALGFTGSAPLGGAGSLDAIMVLAIFGIVFGLSIDYEVFLLARIREGYDRTRTTAGAVEYGLRKTAGVITGAALIMTGVFVAFAMADIASMRQLGVGLTTAVILDATVVRLVLLPALIKLCGAANWWLPGWLDRLLPKLDVEGADLDRRVDGNGHGTLPLELRDEIERARRVGEPVT
jgi:RND superfamily putative drug exporter